MAEGLKLIVSADTKQAEAVIKDFVKTTAAAGEQAGASLGSGLNKSIPVIENIPKAAKPALKAISSLGDSIETLRAKLLAAKEFKLLTTDPNKIIALNDEIRVLELELKRVNSLGTPAFNNLSTSVKTAGSSFGSIVTGANKAFSVLRQAAFILPGIGIAGILGGITSGIISLFSSSDDAVKSVDKVNKKLDEAEEKQKRFSEAVDKAAGSLISEEAKLADLRAILTTTNSSLVKFTQSTINQGLARFIFDEKNVEVQKLLNAEITKSINLRKQQKPTAGLEFDQNDRQILDLEKKIQKVAALGQPVDGLKKQLKELQDIRISQRSISSLNELGQGLESFFTKFIDNGSGASSIDKTIEQAKKIAAFLDKNTQLSVKFEVNPQDSKEDTLAKAKEFLKKAQQFAETGLPPFPFKLFIRAIPNFIVDQKFLKDIRDQAGEDGTKTFKEAKKAFEDSVTKAGLSNPLVIKVTAEIKAAIKREDAQKEFVKSVLGGNELFNFPAMPKDADGNDLFSKMEFNALKAGSAINQVLTPAFNNLFSSILAGENPLKSFFESLGQSILQLVQKIVAAALQAAILSALLPHGLGGVKGFGGFFKGILGFAAGGVVSGPTLALIGEGSGTSRSNPEVVAPLDKLQGMLQGMSSGGREIVVVSGRTRGNEFKLLANRTDRRDRRLGAK